MLKVFTDIKSEKKINYYFLCSSLLLALVFFTSLYGALFWNYSDSLPAPDELNRMLVPNFISYYNRLPFGTEEAVRIIPWGFSYAMQPYFPSILAAFFMEIGNLITPSVSSYAPTDSLRLDLNFYARLVSVFAATGTTFLALKIGNRLFSRKSSSFLFAALTGLLPQVIYLASYFNNDIFSVFTSYLIVYAWLKGKDSGWEWKDCLFLSAGIALCMLTYYFAYGFIVASILVFNVTYLVKKPKQYKELIQKEIFIIGAVFLMAGWFFVWNYIKFDDFIGLKTSEKFGELYGSIVPPLKPSLRPTPQRLGISLYEMLFEPFQEEIGRSWIDKSWASFIGCFGPLQLRLSGFIYKIYSLLILAGFGIGCFISALKSRKNKLDENVILLSLVICLVLPIAFSIYYSFTTDYQAQGRYMMSMLLPLMLYTTIGYDFLSQKFRQMNIVISGLWIGLFLYVLTTVMLPNL